MSFIKRISNLQQFHQLEIKGNFFIIKNTAPTNEKSIDTVKKIIKRMEQIEKKGTLEEKVELLIALNKLYKNT